MALKAIAFSVSAVGVAAFFVGLFGIPQDWSLELSVVGLLLLLVGVAALLSTLRSTKIRRPHVSLFVVIAVAIVLHSYEAFVKSSGEFYIGFFLWPLAPYALCLIVACLSASSLPAA